jgi:hypothetical protein
MVGRAMCETRLVLRKIGSVTVSREAIRLGIASLAG